ncbi:putative sulfate exporter family transporter [Agrobacterium vitis]|nr:MULTISPECIES: putative sulfate exporter family transporter [Rhizobium/Agrobacterium group]MCF1446143.1 putative sulfate exporter family transporter [Allorhizobium ampelinum]MCF1492975.1 putative sulfate exporter family transporter [Allorhizobium ampelinum]MUO27472.1 putative sulfate exporter family transporter [Agrobacterium vitis]MUO42078.1 putative sulfate exporter family transporter [Agrobacterium vitis]MUP09386.1 putative sulfate exporter family transporter [Agrobacterium vitis]
MRLFRPVVSLAPGIALSSAVALGGYALAFTVQRVTGRMPVDALVWCILLGTLVKSLFILPQVVNKGIHLCAKTVLELAIVLLGASVSISQIAGSGFTLIAWVIAVVCCGLVSSYVIGRVIGLPHPLALLVACGNSICGNSAIMAAAPVIGADADEVASSIAFTAVLGILVVLLLPLVAFQAGLDPRHYGILAGMTVYAVPQVLAATASFGLVSLQIGTLVKLIRVMMLGPVLLGLGMSARGMGMGSGLENERKIGFAQLAPWFIVGFLALMVARSMDVPPHGLLEPSQHLSGFLTTLSMAALGLQVDLRSLLASGGRVLAAGSLSILALGAIALTAIHFMV